MDAIELKQKLLSIKNTDSSDNVQLIKQKQIREIYKKYTKEQISNYEKKIFNVRKVKYILLLFY